MPNLRPYIAIVIIMAVLGIAGWIWSFQASRNVRVAPAIQTPASSTTPDPATEEPLIPPSLPSSSSLPPSSEATPNTISRINYSVPFTAQAPNGEWDDERQQDGCEEASALMAMCWVQNQSLSPAEARREILAISDYEQNQYGEFRDVSLADVRERIFKGYFKYDAVEVKMNIKAADIVAALNSGAIVLTPMNGQRLNNPNFTAPGPERHMLLIKGYDPDNQEFITNDPGTRNGADYRYSENTIMNSILAYPTGYHEPINGEPKGILIVRKK